MSNSSSSHSYTKNHDLIIKALNIKPIVPNKTYNLKSDSVKEYIEASNPEIKDYLEKFFKITKHVSYKTFKFLLYNNFREFLHYCVLNNVNEITIYLGKIDYQNITQKSNFWVAQHFYQYLKKKRNLNINIRVVLDFNKIKDNDTVLILDDCSYTGTQLSGIIHANSNEINKRKNVVFYIIIAFISESARHIINDMFMYYIDKSNKAIFSKNNVIIKPLKDLMDEDEIKLINKYYNIFYPDFTASLSVELKNKYPIYFDHKLADYVSTFTDIYSGIVFNPHNKKIIPIMNNCEHIVKVDFKDLYNPLCPFPPYKNSFTDGKIDENYKIKSDSLSSDEFYMKQKSLSLSSSKVKSKEILIDNLRKFKIELDKNKKLKKLFKKAAKTIEPKVKEPKKIIPIEPKVKEIKQKEPKEPKEPKVKEIKQKKPIESNEEILKKIKIKPLIPIKTYGLNEENINKYIKLSKKEIKNELIKFFEVTKHISYKNFVKVLYDNFKYLIDYCYTKKISSISLYLGKIDEESNKITNKSNFWIAQHFYQFIKMKKIKLNINIIFDLKNINDDDFILILDDCSYTGTQLSSFILNKSKTINNFTKIKFFFLIPFISKYSIEIIKDTFKSYLKSSHKPIFSKKSEIIEPLKKLMTKDEIKLLKKYYIDKENISDIISFENKYPIYFDHKLSDIFTTYTDIYNGIDVFNKKNNIITRVINEIPKPPYKINAINETNIDKYKYLSSFSSSVSSSSSSSLLSSLKPSIKKECPPGKILNPKTKRCIDKNGATAKTLLKEKKTLKENPELKELLKKKCPPGKILNPKTDRCIDKNGATAKKLLKV